MTTFTYPSEYFDIEATLTCGQLFRYEKIAEKEYVVYSMDKRCRLREDNGAVLLTTEDEEYFRNYFDLAFPYDEIVKRYVAFPELEKAVKHGKGIRILRQSLYETVISFIISANNNIKRIQGIINRLCVKYGTKMDDYYAFPTIKQLQAATVEELKALGLGYRAQYIYETTKTLEAALSELQENIDEEKERKILLSQKGIGPKVADCIMLFGLRRLNAYPVDTWIFKANQTAELNTPQKVREYYSRRYGEYAGIAQQYIFHYARNASKNGGEE